MPFVLASSSRSTPSMPLCSFFFGAHAGSLELLRSCRGHLCACLDALCERVSESTARKQCERGGIFDISNAEKKTRAKVFSSSLTELFLSLSPSSLLSSLQKTNKTKGVSRQPTSASGRWRGRRARAEHGEPTLASAAAAAAAARALAVFSVRFWAAAVVVVVEQEVEAAAARPSRTNAFFSRRPQSSSPFDKRGKELSARVCIRKRAGARERAIACGRVFSFKFLSHHVRLFINTTITISRPPARVPPHTRALLLALLLPL